MYTSELSARGESTYFDARIKERGNPPGLRVDKDKTSSAAVETGVSRREVQTQRRISDALDQAPLGSALSMLNSGRGDVCVQ